jgi:hypothetical protein
MVNDTPRMFWAMLSSWFEEIKGVKVKAATAKVQFMLPKDMIIRSLPTKVVLIKAS